MVTRNKERLIGGSILRREEANDFALSLFPEKSQAVMVSIYKSPNKYGLRVQLEDYMESWHRTMYSIRTNPKNKKALKKIVNDLAGDEPLRSVDTSKWPKPDTESIIWANVEAMIMLELVKEKTVDYGIWKGREEALYSVLNCKSQTNPQTMYTMSHSDMLESAMYALSSDKKKHFGYWEIYLKVIDPKQKKGTCGREDWDKMKTQWNLWKAKAKKDIFSTYIWSRKSPGYKDFKKKMIRWGEETKEALKKTEKTNG